MSLEARDKGKTGALKPKELSRGTCQGQGFPGCAPDVITAGMWALRGVESRELVETEPGIPDACVHGAGAGGEEPRWE